jgi:hypothetical protein
MLDIKTRTERFGLEVMLVTFICEVFESNLDQYTGYPNWSFSWFSSEPPWKCRDNTLFIPGSLPSQSFPIHHISTIISFNVISGAVFPKVGCTALWGRKDYLGNVRGKGAAGDAGDGPLQAVCSLIHDWSDFRPDTGKLASLHQAIIALRIY